MAYLNSRNQSIPTTAGGVVISERSRKHFTLQNPSSSVNFIELFFGQKTIVVLGQGLILEPGDVFVIDQQNDQKIQAIADTLAVTVRIVEGA